MIYSRDRVAIPDGEAAIVTSGGMTAVEVYIPDRDDEPPLLAYLLAVAVRVNDPGFVREQVDWYNERRGS